MVMINDYCLCSGTNWMQEIVSLVLNGGDLTPVQTIPNWDRVPWLETIQPTVPLDARTSPRAMVTHLPYHCMSPSFFTSQAKVIYVTRNPKDVAASFYKFRQQASFFDDPGTFDQFLDSHLAGMTLCRVVQFLGRELSQEVLEKVADHCQFSNMKKSAIANPALQHPCMEDLKTLFFRKGIAGDWRNHFSPEQEARFTAVIKEEMKGTHYNFPWDNE
ncbi:hypothetical protein AAFF_G00204960 [Aldrovandia affinis]|uniref:Sulfotransferase n=1 Tax=Aldrovandia affinis TaxID=143900 RepID=A0AAD7RI37_9TELE|nr:hypothetical protein AAFF_G00204960 [Aldrovandia affinis]